jgi:ribosomal protein S18 acetylase RimI-like enzyme
MIVIRRIGKGEFELYRRIRLEALKESPAAFLSKYEDAILRTDESWIAQSDGLALAEDRCGCLAFDGDSPIGISALYGTRENAGEMELMQVWVAPGHRGQGIAGRILAWLSDWARARGVARIVLHSWKGNAAANAFYRKAGFAVCGTAEDEGQLFMAKTLATESPEAG